MALAERPTFEGGRGGTTAVAAFFKPAKRTTADSHPAESGLSARGHLKTVRVAEEHFDLALGQ